jgi:YD repeat-containing protein
MRFLPNNTAWTFQYDPNNGMLIEVTLPTGGTVSYVGNINVVCLHGSYPGLRSLWKTVSPEATQTVQRVVIWLFQMIAAKQAILRAVCKSWTQPMAKLFLPAPLSDAYI